MTKSRSKHERRRQAQRATRRRAFGACLAAIALLGIGTLVLTTGTGDEPAGSALEFELESASGGTASLSDYRGQPLAVTFMHTY